MIALMKYLEHGFGAYEIVSQHKGRRIGNLMYIWKRKLKVNIILKLVAHITQNDMWIFLSQLFKESRKENVGLFLSR